MLSIIPENFVRKKLTRKKVLGWSSPKYFAEMSLPSRFRDWIYWVTMNVSLYIYLLACSFECLNVCLYLSLFISWLLDQ